MRGDGDRGWEGEGRGRGDTSGSRKGRGRGALLCEKVGRPPPLKPPCLRGRECRKPGSAPDTGGRRGPRSPAPRAPREGRREERGPLRAGVPGPGLHPRQDELSHPPRTPHRLPWKRGLETGLKSKQKLKPTPRFCFLKIPFPLFSVRSGDQRRRGRMRGAGGRREGGRPWPEAPRGGLTPGRPALPPPRSGPPRWGVLWPCRAPGHPPREGGCAGPPTRYFNAEGQGGPSHPHRGGNGGADRLRFSPLSRWPGAGQAPQPVFWMPRRRLQTARSRFQPLYIRVWLDSRNSSLPTVSNLISCPHLTIVWVYIKAPISEFSRKNRYWPHRAHVSSRQ